MPIPDFVVILLVSPVIIFLWVACFCGAVAMLKMVSGIE